MSNSNHALLAKVRQACDPLEEIIFSHTDEFVERFCKITDVMDLISLRFSSNTVEFVYVSDEGQHFVDSIDYEELEAWLDEVHYGH